MINTIQKAIAAKRDELREDEKGFTLIELLVVVLIIGILAAIAIPVFLGQQEAAKDSAVKSDLGNAKVALIAYQVEHPAEDTLPALNTLANYGFTQSEFTTSITATGSYSAGFTITGVSATNKTFQITSAGGVTEVSGGGAAAAADGGDDD